MLVLARKAGERIVIGDDIELVVVSIRGGCIRLGIQAPKDVKILRSEIKRYRTDEDGNLRDRS